MHPVIARRHSAGSRLAMFGALLAALVTSVLVAPPADAATAYRYWGYWHGTASPSWKFANTGPAGYVPRDGSVEGWRFAVVANDAPAPRLSSTAFGKICGATAPVRNAKRVAVVLDYGVARDAVKGDRIPRLKTVCAVVPVRATGAAVLGVVTRVRSSGGLVCAITLFPSKGCGDAVKI